MEYAAFIWENLLNTFGVKFFLSPFYVGATLLIVYGIWIWRGKPASFLRFTFPRELYFHPSTWVDIKVGLFNTLFAATGVYATLFFAPSVTFALLNFFSTSDLAQSTSDETGLMEGALVAALLFLTQDFCRYWNHYLHHETRFLWPFHAVHHSAEVMTPLTFLRAHPLYSILQALLISFLVGLVQALVLLVLVGQIEYWVIFAGTLAFNAYVFFGAHLRHSHIWVSYGRRMEHILISPSQHQIHHSSDPKHHDKNYGEVFAIWDWIFGTLYVPDEYEDLNYGLATSDGTPIPQKHTTLKEAMIGPFEEVWRDLIKGTSKDKETAKPTVSS